MVVRLKGCVVVYGGVERTTDSNLRVGKEIRLYLRKEAAADL